MMDEDEEGVEDKTDPILHYLRNYYISHTDRETLLESATVGNRVSEPSSFGAFPASAPGIFCQETAPAPEDIFLKNKFVRTVK